MKKKIMQKEGMKFTAIAAAFIFIAIANIGVVNAESLDESQTDISTEYAFLPGEAKAQVFRVDDPWLWKVEFYYSPGDCGILKVLIDTDFNGSNGNLTYHIFDTTSWTTGWHTWDIRSLDGDIHLTTGNAYVLTFMPGVFSTNPKWYGTNGTTDVYTKGRAYYINETGEHPLDLVDYGLKIYTDVDPIANFTYSTDALTIYVDASPSYTPDGDPITSYEWDWDGDDIYEDIGITANHTYSIAGEYTIKLRITDEDGHTDIETKSVEITTNQVPIAEFNYTINSMTVTVDASASYDPDGTIILYEWDWESDGIYDENHTIPAASHTYENEGNYTITLRVTDDDGATATTTSSQSGGWIIINENDKDIWKLPFSWFAIFIMIAIGVIGMSLSAFFLKPESIKHLGYAPAAGTMLITVFTIIAILLYHADVEWYWIIIDVALIFFILFITVKILVMKKKKVAKSIFRIKKKNRKKRRRR